MWRFLKTTEAEDATTTEEVLVVLAEVVLVVIEVLPLEEKETLLQDGKADLEATEVRHQEAADSDHEKKVVFRIEPLARVVLAEEAILEARHQEAEVFRRTERQEDPMLQDQKGSQTEHQDVRKVPQILQEREDQEEVNTIC